MQKRQQTMQSITPVAVAFCPAIRVDREEVFYRCYDPRSGRRVILTAQVGAAIDSSYLLDLDSEALQEIEALITLGMVHICHT
jgi:hypothetical protein